MYASCVSHALCGTGMVFPLPLATFASPIVSHTVLTDESRARPTRSRLPPLHPGCRSAAQEVFAARLRPYPNRVGGRTVVSQCPSCRRDTDQDWGSGAALPCSEAVRLVTGPGFVSHEARPNRDALVTCGVVRVMHPRAVDGRWAGALAPATLAGPRARLAASTRDDDRPSGLNLKEHNSATPSRGTP